MLNTFTWQVKANIMMGAACTIENRSVLNSVPAHVLKDQPLEQSTNKTKTNLQKEAKQRKRPHIVKSVTLHRPAPTHKRTPLQKPPTLLHHRFNGLIDGCKDQVKDRCHTKETSKPQGIDFFQQ